MPQSRVRIELDDNGIDVPAVGCLLGTGAVDLSKPSTDTFTSVAGNNGDTPWSPCEGDERSARKPWVTSPTAGEAPKSTVDAESIFPVVQVAPTPVSPANNPPAIADDENMPPLNKSVPPKCSPSNDCPGGFPESTRGEESVAGAALAVGAAAGTAGDVVATGTAVVATDAGGRSPNPGGAGELDVVADVAPLVLKNGLENMDDDDSLGLAVVATVSCAGDVRDSASAAPPCGGRPAFSRGPIPTAHEGAFGSDPTNCDADAELRGGGRFPVVDDDAAAAAGGDATGGCSVWTGAGARVAGPAEAAAAAAAGAAVGVGGAGCAAGVDSCTDSGSCGGDTGTTGGEAASSAICGGNSCAVCFSFLRRFRRLVVCGVGVGAGAGAAVSASEGHSSCSLVGSWACRCGEAVGLAALAPADVFRLNISAALGMRTPDDCAPDPFAAPAPPHATPTDPEVLDAMEAACGIR